jgi:5-formyltetrahydrofolate cyclo-ligase
VQTKTNIRKQLLEQRNKLKADYVSEQSQRITTQLSQHTIFNQAKTIASYMAFANEINLLTLLTLPKRFVLPVIQPKQTMVFKQFQSTKLLTKNKYGILEPKESKQVNTEEIDLCLVPLVGFNRKGSRLGMGGGYYDRYFELNNFKQKPTILVGIAYDFQENDTIQTEAWDIPLDIIFTNKEVIKP